MAGWHQGSRHDRGYGGAWDKLRLTILARDRHLCLTCLKTGRPTPATEVDHIIPKAKGGTDDPGNLASICNDCHREKTGREAAEAQGRKAKPRSRYDAKGFPIWNDRG